MAKLIKLNICLMLLAFTFAPASVQAWGLFNNCNQCCEVDSCNDCCYNPPLTCGSFGVQVNGGWCPINNTEKGRVWLTVPAFGDDAVFSVSRTAQFRNQFKTPWIVSGLLTYNLSDNVQVFGEINYRQASGKTYNFTAGTFIVSETSTDFKSWAGYLGGRYFFERLWCNTISPFVGFKAGLVHNKQVRYDLSLFGTFIQTQPYWLGNTAVSAGLQIGLDYAVTCNLGVVFTLEAVATQGMKNNRNVVFADPVATGGLTNVNIGPSGIQMSYPITLGLRYNF